MDRIYDLENLKDNLNMAVRECETVDYAEVLNDIIREIELELEQLYEIRKKEVEKENSERDMMYWGDQF